jgi:hypothetical protein
MIYILLLLLKHISVTCIYDIRDYYKVWSSLNAFTAVLLCSLTREDIALKLGCSDDCMSSNRMDSAVVSRAPAAAIRCRATARSWGLGQYNMIYIYEYMDNI